MSQYLQLAEEFQQSGFANGGQVIDQITCEVLNKEVLRVIAERDRDGIPQPVLTRDLISGGDKGGNGTDKDTTGHKPIWQILNIWQASPFTTSSLTAVSLKWRRPVWGRKAFGSGMTKSNTSRLKLAVN